MVQLFAEPLTEEPTVDGCRLECTETDGTVEAVAVDSSGTSLGLIRIHARSHGDPFFGALSRNDEQFVYVSKLEVTPAARGRGMGSHLMRVSRWVAYDETGRGVKTLVAPDNAISLRCHDAAGFDPPRTRLMGLRLGSRVLWLSRTRLTA